MDIELFCSNAFPDAAWPMRNLRPGVIRALQERALELYADPSRDMQSLVDAGRLKRRELPDGSPIYQCETSGNTTIEKADDGTVDIVASTGDIDRIGDVIDPAGWVLDDFLKNPVMLTDHRYSVSNIVGKATSVSVVGARKSDKGCTEEEIDEYLKRAKEKGKMKRAPGKLKVKAAVDPEGSGAEADAVRAKLDAGSLRTVSVGFRPLEYRAVYDKDDNFLGYLFTKQALLEVSFVAVPANPNATIGATAKPDDSRGMMQFLRLVSADVAIRTGTLRS